MSMFDKIVEEKIREAQQKGELDNLPGQGKPLNLDDLSGIPEDLRAGYSILKNAGVIPEEMELKKEILSLQDLIDACHDDDERTRLRQKLTEKTLRFNSLMEKRNMKSSSAYRQYGNKINNLFK